MCIRDSYLAWSGAQAGRQEALHVAEVYAARMETLLSELFHKTDVLESVAISSKGEVPEHTFLDLAKSLRSGAGIRAIQYLPGGTVRYCYPLEGNEAAVGGNVFENPRRRADAQLAVDTKGIALSGPYKLTQGGFGLVARNPIFLTDSGGTESFWGFSAIILDLPEALSSVNFGELSRDGYEFSLCCTIAGEEVVIQQSAGFSGKEAVDSVIHVPNHSWTLRLEPQNGWIGWREIATAMVFVLLLSLFCSVGYAQLKEKQEILRYYAETDELTGILNRRGLTEATEEWCRKKQPFTLLYMDLDRFKGVNDTFGHAMGDRLLQEMARRLKHAVGADAVCGRIGGDEFVALKLDPEQEPARIAGVRNMIAPPLVLDGHTLDVALSVGCAHFPQEGGDYDALVKIADERMYADKKTGKSEA